MKKSKLIRVFKEIFKKQNVKIVKDVKAINKVQQGKIVGVAWGTENGADYYVQTVCNCKEHYSGCNGVIGFGENFTKKDAKQLAQVKGKEYNAQVLEW